MMSEKLANKGVSPNTCIHPCPTVAGLIEPIHHNDWINLPFENTSLLYTKLSESNLYSASSLLFSLSPKFFLALPFFPYLSPFSPPSLYSSKSLRGNEGEHEVCKNRKECTLPESDEKATPS